MKPWLRATVLIGIGYAAAGILFAIPRSHVEVWRFAAWGVSGILLSVHTAYENFRLQHRPMTAAWHVGLGGAIGGLGIALGANLRSLLSATPNPRQQMLLASLAIWPFVTGIPSYLVALCMSAVLARTRG